MNILGFLRPQTTSSLKGFLPNDSVNVTATRLRVEGSSSEDGLRKDRQLALKKLEDYSEIYPTWGYDDSYAIIRAIEQDDYSVEQDILHILRHDDMRLCFQLLGRVLPNWGWLIRSNNGKDETGGSFCHITPPIWPTVQGGISYAPSPTRAFMAALIKAVRLKDVTYDHGSSK